jgi:hypothetical protein
LTAAPGNSRIGSLAAWYASSIRRMVVTALAAVVGNGSPSSAAAANARSCHANVVSAEGFTQPVPAAARSAPRSSLTADPPRVTISRPSCARTKFRSHSVPSDPMTWTSARNSPSLVKADSNQPVRPEANATRPASARSVTRSGIGSASAAGTDGSPAPAAEPTSRRQSIA